MKTALLDVSERIHAPDALVMRLHQEFPLVGTQTITEIIRAEQEAMGLWGSSDIVPPAVTAGAVEVVASRQAAAELDAMLTSGASATSPLDRDLWVVEDQAESYAGQVERIGSDFFVSDASGHRTGTYPTRAAATVIYPGAHWRHIYAGQTR